MPLASWASGMTCLFLFVSFRFLPFFAVCFAYVSCCAVVKDDADAVDNETMAQCNDEAEEDEEGRQDTGEVCIFVWVCVCCCCFAVYPTILWRLFPVRCVTTKP